MTLSHLAVANQKHRAHGVLQWFPGRKKSVNVVVWLLTLSSRLRNHCKTFKPV